jgi:hypothetical protein
MFLKQQIQLVLVLHAGRESDPRVVGGFFNFIKNDTTSYTGFTFFPASGTMTGSVSVYGYSK